MKVVDQVRTIAEAFFNEVLKASAEQDSTFRALVSTDVGGEMKPLLLLGTAHGGFEDGHVTAVVNPDKSLADDFDAGWGMNSMVLKERVAKRCDIAMHLWVNAYRKDGACITSKYRAREFKPAKFAVA